MHMHNMQHRYIDTHSIRWLYSYVMQVRHRLFLQYICTYAHAMYSGSFAFEWTGVLVRRRWWEVVGWT